MRNPGRLSLACVIATAAAVAVATLTGGAGQEEDSFPPGQGQAEFQTAWEVLEPDPRLRPEEVVAYQLEVLGLSGSGQAGIRLCYRFASPLNRAATGPIARFVRMIRSPPYDVMLRAGQTLVGKAVIRGERAAVLVTLIDPAQDIRVFRFFLSKQRESPYAGCWMTDAVREVTFAGPEPPAGSSAPAVGV